MNAENILSPSCTDGESPPNKPVPKTQHVVSKKMKWTQEEDELLKKRIEKYGTGNWSLIAQEFSGRTGKQCRERWTNQLNPNLNKENWTMTEDHILLQQQKVCGNSWSKISRYLPGRSSNSVKNRWSWLVRHRIMPTISHQQQSPVMPVIVKTKPPEQIKFYGPEPIDALPLFLMEGESGLIDLNLEKISDPLLDSFDRGYMPLWEIN